MLENIPLTITHTTLTTATGTAVIARATVIPAIMDTLAKGITATQAMDTTPRDLALSISHTLTMATPMLAIPAPAKLNMALITKTMDLATAGTITPGLVTLATATSLMVMATLATASSLMVMATQATVTLAMATQAKGTLATDTMVKARATVIPAELTTATNLTAGLATLAMDQLVITPMVATLTTMDMAPTTVTVALITTNITA